MTHVLIEQDKTGYAWLITKPSTIDQCKQMQDIRPVCKDCIYSIITIDEAIKHNNLIGRASISEEYRFRILTPDYQVKETKIGSWFTLERAKELVNYAAGEMIYQYDNQFRRLWETL